MLPKGAYTAKEHEALILSEWLENKIYKPEFDPVTNKVQSLEEMKADPREAWCLICPPPNAYGRPHIGNISGYAYMDALARYQRMLNKKVLVLPGKDHAGLEGEGVFVREVLEKKKRKKFEMKREDFYQEMMEWFGENMEEAIQDEKNIGLSADFDRDTFTLDPDIVETVLDTFVEMYNKEMIYKGVRIVNWDPKARTAVADNQIEYKDSVTPFYYFKYAFTEPETDAVNIKNEFAGKRVPWTYERSETTTGEEFPAAIGTLETSFEIQTGPLKVQAIGYENLTGGDTYEGDAYAVMMRLDKKFRLVVVNPNFEGNIEDELLKLFLFEISHAPGAHYIRFDEFKEDKYYTNGFILGTVRPETKFGDTAIAVDPKDERYKEFVGTEVEVQTAIGTAKLNIISDYAVDSEFGTGVVKVTPAHSPVDWEIANRHPEECLPAKQVIGYDLRLNHLCGKYEGLRIKEAREELRDDLKEKGLLIYVDENYTNRIAIAERTKAPIEPLLSSQWYLKYDGIREAAIKMVHNVHNDDANLEESIGEISQKIADFDETTERAEDLKVTIHPASMVSKYNHWMNNLRDWAISRSLWWGYRLPVWYHGDIKEDIDANGQVKEFINISHLQGGGSNEAGTGGDQTWVFLEYDNPDHLRVQKESPGEGWYQDENVLDTWFSSGQWPFATLMKHGLMDTFFPTDVLISAADILENWDSRMMMFSFFKTKDVPFKNLFLTGLVKGSDGQKMSKSKGNLLYIDDLVSKYGTDAVRMVYFYQNSAGDDYAMTFEKLETFKRFVNKLWNASKFVLMNLEDLAETDQVVYNQKTDDVNLPINKELLEHLDSVKQHITKNINEYEFGHATYNLYQNFWHEFADRFIEETKQYVYIQRDRETGEVVSEPDPTERLETQKVLLKALKTYLKLAHPFMPFVTERIWKEIPKEEGDHSYLMYSSW